MYSEIGNSLVDYFKLPLRKLPSIFCKLYILSDFLGIKKPKGYVCALLFLVNSKTLARLFRLALKRTDLSFKNGKNILYSVKVILCSLKLALGFLFSVTVFRYTCRLLKDMTSLVALFGYNFGYFTQTDDRISLAANTRVHNELVNVAESSLLIVYKILAFAVAIIATGYGNLVKLGVESVFGVGVVKRYRYLGKAHLTAVVRSAEYNVLHLGTAYITAGKLTENPTHSVGYIGFSTSVRSDDYGCAALEGKHGSVREGFKSVKHK